MALNPSPFNTHLMYSPVPGITYVSTGRVTLSEFKIEKENYQTYSKLKHYEKNDIVGSFHKILCGY